jgi:hypothetical protein
MRASSPLQTDESAITSPFRGAAKVVDLGRARDRDLLSRLLWPPPATANYSAGQRGTRQRYRISKADALEADAVFPVRGRVCLSCCARSPARHGCHGDGAGGGPMDQIPHLADDLAITNGRISGLDRRISSRGTLRRCRRSGALLTRRRAGDCRAPRPLAWHC